MLQQKDLTSQGAKDAVIVFRFRSGNIFKAFLRSNTEIINAQCGLDKNIEKGFIYIKPRLFRERRKLIERILK